MKVTPAHDFHDYELGKKYNLPITPIIDFKGKMDFSWFLSKKDIPERYRKRAEQYHNLHVSKARPLMIEHLKEDGLLARIDEKYEHTVSICYRCGSLLEPLPLPQFFIKVAPLTKKVLQALKTKKVKIHGPGYDKILKHWLKNLQDWNISRQIVWGIRMPIWYSATQHPDIEVTFLNRDKQPISGKLKDLQNYSLEDISIGLQQLKAPMEAEFVVSKTSPGEEYLQETDTFDTWFSSGQWPFATLMSSPKSRPKVDQPLAEKINPSADGQKSKLNDDDQNSDFKRFYPTQVMETAYDILIFWVMRMLMFGIYATGEVPFEHVYLHGLVRDEKGQKMSKSKGNVINPLDIIAKYGADALRMALVMSTTAGRDSSTGEGKIRGMRNFTNKIWNATRFILMMNENEKPTPIPEIEKNDAEFKKHIKQTAETITKQLDDLKVGLAAETVYNEFWHWFCDEAIEATKKGELSLPALTVGLKTFLTLLHPFVPFVTEEAWSKLEKKLLIISKWPD
jgi:valyl-tRNA synthetase